MKSFFRIFCLVFIVCFIFFSFYKRDVIIRNTSAYLDYFAKNTGLVLNEVWVKGRKNLSTEQIILAINMNIGDSILFLDLNAIRKSINSLPWVLDARVFLNIYGILEIEIEEFIPVAVYENNLTSHLIDSFGRKIIRIKKNEYESLIRISGAEAIENMKEIKDIVYALNDYDFSLDKMERVGTRRWDIFFKEGFYVKLPEENPKSAFLRLKSFLSKYDIKSEKLAFIDLRILDRVSLKYRD